MEVFERILGIILPVFIIIALGYAYARRRGDSVKADMTAVNRVSMGVLCPLLVFTALAAKDFDIAHNGTLILAGALISLGSGLLAWPVARMFGYDVRSFVPPMMYNNCGNMGLPLAVLAFGTAGLSSAVALFMACNLVYFSVGIKIIEIGRTGAHTSSWKFLLSPMMVAMHRRHGICRPAYRVAHALVSSVENAGRSMHTDHVVRIRRAHDGCQFQELAHRLDRRSCVSGRRLGRGLATGWRIAHDAGATRPDVFVCRAAASRVLLHGGGAIQTGAGQGGVDCIAGESGGAGVRAGGIVDGVAGGLNFSRLCRRQHLEAVRRQRRFIDVGKGHIAYLRAGWATPRPIDDVLNGCRLAGNDRFHRAIRAIAHPA